MKHIKLFEAFQGKMFRDLNRGGTPDQSRAEVEHLYNGILKSHPDSAGIYWFTFEPTPPYGNPGVKEMTTDGRYQINTPDVNADLWSEAEGSAWEEVVDENPDQDLQEYFDEVANSPAYYAAYAVITKDKSKFVDENQNPVIDALDVIDPPPDEWCEMTPSNFARHIERYCQPKGVLFVRPVY